MNEDNLAKVVMRIPKRMEAKFSEPLKRLEIEGDAMPTFKYVVDFLKERAFVLNHPIFSGRSRENAFTRVKLSGKPPVTPRSLFLLT